MHEVRLHSSVTRLQLAHRLCISLRLSAFVRVLFLCTTTDCRFRFSAYQGRFYYAAKQPVFHSPASLHSHVALNRMFMLSCGVVVRSHDHLASILASLSCSTYCAFHTRARITPACALSLLFPLLIPIPRIPSLTSPVDLPHCCYCYSYAAPSSSFSAP